MDPSCVTKTITKRNEKFKALKIMKKRTKRLFHNIYMPHEQKSNNFSCISNPPMLPVTQVGFNVRY